jgi:hypothetical protein
MFALRQVYGIVSAIGAGLTIGLAGCGTAIQSPSTSPSSAVQPQSKPAVGPVLGYIWDASSQSLRPVQGVPGASIVGAPTVSVSGASFIATASSTISGTALFLDAGGNLFQAPVSGGALTRIATLPGATTLSLSNAGTYAVVTGKDTSGVTSASVISGLPGSPAVRPLNISGYTAILGAAVSDTGTVALAGTGQSGSSVNVFTGTSAGVPVATMQAYGGMQFVPGSDELIVADGGTGALTAISHTSTSPAAANLAAQGAISSPVALDVTSNGRWVVAASHTGDVLRVDLTGATPAAKSHCICAPSQVVAMRGSTPGTTVRLVTAGSGPLWIVDAGGPASRILFVPAVTTATPSTSVAKSAM